MDITPGIIKRYSALLTLFVFFFQVGAFADSDLKVSTGDSSANEFRRTSHAAIAIKPEPTSSLPIDMEKSISKIGKKALKERVENLRREKKDKFKELTEGFIRKIVTEKAIVSKDEFLKPGERNLNDCIERAIQEHVPAKAATERIKLAKQRVIKALRDLFAEATYEFENRDGSLSGQEFKGKSYRMRFKQPVFRGGNLWAIFQKEQATLRGAEAEYTQIVNDLIQKVSEAYFECLRAQIVQKDRETLLRRVNKIHGRSRKMWDQGLISEIEYLNVESLQSQIENDLEQAKQDYELAYLDLQKELNLDIADRIRLVPFYSYKKLMAKATKKNGKPSSGGKNSVVLDSGEPLKPLDEYIKMAYDHRPDLKLEANRLRSNIMAKRAALGKLLPQVNIMMEFGDLGEAFTETADPEVQMRPDYKPEWQTYLELSWNFGGSTVKYTRDRDQNAPSVSQFQSGSGTTTRKDSFSVAILDNIEDVYRLKEAQVEIMDEFVKLEDKEREVIKEVKEAYFNYKRAVIQFQSQIKQLLYRIRQAQLQKHKLEQNEIQASEYIQAENELLEEKAQFHKVMAEYYSARVALNRAVGLRGMLPVKEWE